MKLIAYYRVSTKRQGQSGLGLEAQKSSVQAFAKDKGTVFAEFVEMETGRIATRPQLKAALNLCNATGATLVVAKLDRLARNVLFTATLMNAGVDFVCCDMPSANRMTIHIMAAMAEEEGRMISARTKAALQAAKARGVKLGTPTPGRGGWKCCPNKAERLQAHFEAAYGAVIPMVRELAKRGESAKTIADTLNQYGYRPQRGAKFYPNTVQSILSRL